MRVLGKLGRYSNWVKSNLLLIVRVDKTDCSLSFYISELKVHKRWGVSFLYNFVLIFEDKIVIKDTPTFYVFLLIRDEIHSLRTVVITLRCCRRSAVAGVIYNLTINFPLFSPVKNKFKPVIALSSPSSVCARYLIFPAFTCGVNNASSSGASWK